MPIDRVDFNYITPLPLQYDGVPVNLTPAEEEVAMFYAHIPLDGPQLGTARTAKVGRRRGEGDGTSVQWGQRERTRILCLFCFLHLDQTRVDFPSLLLIPGVQRELLP